jgi:hypothetical protein
VRTTDDEEKHDVNGKDGNLPTDSKHGDDSETEYTAVSESSGNDNTMTTIQQSPSLSPPIAPRCPAFIIHKLDLGWSNFGSSGNSNMSLKALQKAIENLLCKHHCP